MVELRVERSRGRVERWWRRRDEQEKGKVKGRTLKPQPQRMCHQILKPGPTARQFRCRMIPCAEPGGRSEEGGRKLGSGLCASSFEVRPGSTSIRIRFAELTERAGRWYHPGC